MVRLVKSGHTCDLGGWGANGDVVECACGRRYKFHSYPNPAFAGWVQTWPSVFGLRRHTPPKKGGAR